MLLGFKNKSLEARDDTTLYFQVCLTYTFILNDNFYYD